MDYLSRDSGPAEDIPGAAKPIAPLPLLPYPAAVAGHVYGLDVLVRGLLLINCRCCS